VRLLTDCEEGMKNYEALKRQNAINEEKVGKKEVDMQELRNREQVKSSTILLDNMVLFTDLQIVFDEDAQQLDAKND
jgi:hypothetical protein